MRCRCSRAASRNTGSSSSNRPARSAENAVSETLRGRPGFVPRIDEQLESLLVADAVRSQTKGLIHPFQSCRSGAERDIDRVGALERGKVDRSQRGRRIAQASALHDQFGRNVASAEGIARATRQPRRCRNLDRSHRGVRPEGRSRRRRPKYHGIRVTKANRTHENFDVMRELWRRIDPGKHRHEPPLPDEPGHRVSKGRVVSPADESAAAADQHVDLCVCLHVRRMRTPGAYACRANTICGQHWK